jgi:hypothetical protein
VFGAAPGDVRGDFEPSDLVAVALVVVAAVGVEVLRAAQVGRVCLGSAGPLGSVGSAGSRRCGCRRSAWWPAGCREPRRSRGACCRSCPGPPGTGRWPHHLSSPADGLSRLTPGRDRVCRPPAVRPAAARAGAARPRPRSTPAVASSRSSRNRSRVSAGGSARGCRCRARTGCRTEPAGHRADDARVPEAPALRGSSMELTFR